jgi:uncharacterized membrane protein YccC
VDAIRTEKPPSLRWPSVIDWGAAALGLQMAVAGLVAYFCALALRLDYPAWSIFTVVMLLLAQYVGAIHEKSLFRMIGTIVGGCLAYFATGAWQQSPVLYLAAAFVMVTFTVAMFGQSRAPYAFFLTGLTYVVICANSQTTPEDSWAYALARIEEVLVGVVVSMVVQSTVFPRFANKDFRAQLHAALDELAEATPRAAERFSVRHSGLAAALKDFPTRATSMRNLLRFGARESRDFRREIAAHAETVTLITRAASLLRSLEEVEPVPEPYREALRGLVTETGAFLAEGWLQLQRAEGLDGQWMNRAQELEKQIEARLLELRRDPATAGGDGSHAGVVSEQLMVWREVRQAIGQINEVRQRAAESTHSPEALAMAPAWPDAFWLRLGVRSGLAVVVAFALENWLSPPGGPLMVLSTLMFTSCNALSPEGSGDRGAFGYVIGFTLILAAGTLLLLLGTPLLASYAVLNILLATWLFLLGYWIHNRGGVTVPVQVSVLALVSIVALNAQEPVSFQQIMGLTLGLINGLLIASVAQRLLWPVLPQNQLRLGVADYLRTAMACLPSGVEALPLWQRTKLALFPSQARKLISVMRSPACPPEEVARLEDYIRLLQRLTGTLLLCAGRLRPALAAVGHTTPDPPLQEVKAALHAGIEELATSFTDARSPRNLPTDLEQLIPRWDDYVVKLRQRLVEADVSPADVIPLLALCARYRCALEQLLQARTAAGRLRLDDYLGDVAL